MWVWVCKAVLDTTVEFHPHDLLPFNASLTFSFIRHEYIHVLITTHTRTHHHSHTHHHTHTLITTHMHSHHSHTHHHTRTHRHTHALITTHTRTHLHSHMHSSPLTHALITTHPCTHHHSRIQVCCDKFQQCTWHSSPRVWCSGNEHKNLSLNKH